MRITNKREFLAGIFTGLGIAICSYIPLHGIIDNPVSAYVQDVNSDGREDFVVKQSNGEKYAFINMGDGTYLSLGSYGHSRMKSVDDKLKSLAREKDKRQVLEDRELIKKSQVDFSAVFNEIKAIQSNITGEGYHGKGAELK